MKYYGAVWFDPQVPTAPFSVVRPDKKTLGHKLLEGRGLTLLYEFEFESPAGGGSFARAEQMGLSFGEI